MNLRVVGLGLTILAASSLSSSAFASGYDGSITFNPTAPKVGQSFTITGTYSWTASDTTVDSAQLEIWDTNNPQNLVSQPRTTNRIDSTNRTGTATAAAVGPTPSGTFEARLILKDSNGTVLKTIKQSLTVSPPDGGGGGGGT